MEHPWIWYGGRRVPLTLPASVVTTMPEPRPSPADRPDEMAIVARALDDPVVGPSIEALARDARHVAVVVPGPHQPTAADRYLLALFSRLAMARHGPRSLSVIVARGVHPSISRGEVAELVGADVMGSLRPVQSAPEGPELNVEIGRTEELGPVRVHRLVAEADLVVLAGAVAPDHLAGFLGGADGLVPGVAERATARAAHRLAMRTAVRPDGGIRSLARKRDAFPFREALDGAVALHGRCRLLNVILDPGGRIAVAVSGPVRAGFEGAVDAWEALHGDIPDPDPADLVVAGTREPWDATLAGAYGGLVGAHQLAKPGAPVVWLVRAPKGAGPAGLLPWYQTRGLDRHLAALRARFEPEGLTAYVMRRIAQERPVHVVTEVDRDLLLPMGFHPADTLDQAVARAFGEGGIRTCTVLPSGTPYRSQMP